jgi:hypothetical protein
VAILMLGFHFITIRYEESRLTERYGESFREYLANVPRLFPRLLPWRGGQGKFSFALLRANKELIRAFLGLLFLIAMLLLARYLGPAGH